MTDLWRTSPGYWRIQTDNPVVFKKLSRRKGFKRCIWGMTGYLSGLSFGPMAAVKAIKLLKGTTGGVVCRNKLKDIWSVDF